MKFIGVFRGLGHAHFGGEYAHNGITYSARYFGTGDCAVTEEGEVYALCTDVGDGNLTWLRMEAPIVTAPPTRQG